MIIAMFLAFFIAYAIKDYMNGYNNLRKSPITMEAVAMLGVFLTLSTVILEPYKIWLETNFKKMLIILGVLNVCCSVMAVVSYGVAS
jgi:fluoride ion exporter CrcB/FEX